MYTSVHRHRYMAQIPSLFTVMYDRLNFQTSLIYKHNNLFQDCCLCLKPIHTIILTQCIDNIRLWCFHNLLKFISVRHGRVIRYTTFHNILKYLSVFVVKRTLCEEMYLIIHRFNLTIETNPPTDRFRWFTVPSPLYAQANYVN